MLDDPIVAVLFDIDGTLISTGGAGGVSWREAFQELNGIPADIGEHTDAGMTDPEVARLTVSAAQAVGAVAVATGKFDEAQLRATGAEHVLASLAQELLLGQPKPAQAA